MITATNRYLFGADLAAARRLAVLNEVYGRTSRMLLEQAGLQAA